MTSSLKGKGSLARDDDHQDQGVLENSDAAALGLTLSAIGESTGDKE